MNPENLKRAAELFEKQQRLNEWEKLLKAEPSSVVKFTNKDFILNTRWSNTSLVPRSSSIFIPNGCTSIRR